MKQIAKAASTLAARKMGNRLDEEDGKQTRRSNQ
jgi:hypothetical protein